MVVKESSGGIAGVNCTILREHNGPKPLFAADSDNPYNNTDRNAFFRYQPMSRLANLVTTRSNVYAVWVTIGFFEVEDAPDWSDNAVRTRFNDDINLYKRVYPDGYAFGKEAGHETGDIERLRGFAIIDRSIPVAFEPGEDLNTENVIRLKRRIE